jgi:hypothetical protein
MVRLCRLVTILGDTSSTTLVVIQAVLTGVCLEVWREARFRFGAWGFTGSATITIAPCSIGGLGALGYCRLSQFRILVLMMLCIVFCVDQVLRDSVHSI